MRPDKAHLQLLCLDIETHTYGVTICTVYQTYIQRSAEKCSLLNLCLTVVVLVMAKWTRSMMTIDQAAAQPAGMVSHVGNGDRFVCHSLSDCRPPGEWTCVFVFSFVCCRLHVCAVHAGLIG